MIRAVNASTTYGLDGSVANNYGLGSSFRSTAVLATAQAQQNAAPSWLWLVAFIVLVKVL